MYITTDLNAATQAAYETITLGVLAELPCWVAWETRLRDPTDDKPTKLPVNPKNGRNAHADKPPTWGTREQAAAREPLLTKPFGQGGIGLEFAPLMDGRHTGGIDLDSCRDPETGEISAWAQDIIARFQSYAEVSPSQTGVKIFFTYAVADRPRLQAALGNTVKGGPKHGRLWAQKTNGDHPPAIELHLSNRYFAVTDQRLPECPEELRCVPCDDLLFLIEHEAPAFMAEGGGDDDAATAEAPKRKRGAITKADRSRSAAAFNIARTAVRDGATFEEMVARIEADPETALWCRQKGHANGDRELLRLWDKTQPKRGPLIRYTAGDLHLHTNAAEQSIIDASLPVFQRGKLLQMPTVHTMPAAHGRTTFVAGLAKLSAHALIDLLCGCSEWVKWDGRSEDWVQISPPMPIAEILLSREGRWRFPTIAGVITTPTLRPDGTILSERGYDPATRLYHAADPNLTLRPSVDAPTRGTAREALAALCELLAEFPFVGDEGDANVARSVALSALITPVVRGALDTAPLHLFRASTAGSGKSYLADIASAIATGRPCPVTSVAPEEAETEKRLVGLLLSGVPIVNLDNVNGELGGDLLCQMMTQRHLRVRRLGGSDMFEIESAATIFATGNNAVVRGDMVRRTLVADLDPGQERPELRKFKHDPVTIVLENRGHYVSAALTVVRAYILAGCPDSPDPLNSFRDWSTLVRGALIWLGCADSVKSMEAAREDDPELSELREMLGAWHSVFGTNAQTLKSVIVASEKPSAQSTGAHDGSLSYPELRDVLERMFGQRGVINSKALGKWLRARSGRIVGKLRFTKAGEDSHTKTALWKVEVRG